MQQSVKTHQCQALGGFASVQIVPVSGKELIYFFEGLTE
jgi:hypothetical protein